MRLRNRVDRHRSRSPLLANGEQLTRHRRRRRLLAERLEDRRLLAGIDFGDAPDFGVGTGSGNYQTLVGDNGPSHTVVPGLFLGNRVDPDDGLQQSTGANADDTSNLLADLAADFVAGTTAGQSVIPTTASGGSWRYLTSNAVNPYDASANLQDMVWDTSGFFEDTNSGNHTDGFNGVYLGFPGGGEIAVHPRRFTPNTVARWIAGPDDAGEITVDGHVAKSDDRGGDGVRFYVYVDGALAYQQTIAGTDGRGTYFTLSDLVVNVGSTVDFVVNANDSNNDFDGTRLGATISSVDDEDGIDGNLRDLHLFPGAATEITLNATNTTAVEATLAGWIDYNADGMFDNATERAVATVPAGSNNAPVTLVFPEAPDNAVFDTYARFRLSSDAAFVADPQSSGGAVDGEVEDYLIGTTTRIWDGEAGDNQWLNPLNWALRRPDGTITNSNVVPRSGENALIPDDFADQTIVLGTDSSPQVKISSIRSAAPLLIQKSGSLYFTEDSRLAGLTLDGTGNYRVLETPVAGGRKLVIDGDMDWNRDTIFNLSLQVGGSLTIATDQPKSLYAAAITVQGDNSVWSGGDVGMFGSVIYNHGTLSWTTNADVPDTNATFVNSAGAVLIHDAPAAASDIKIFGGSLHNHGVMEVRQGTLQLGSFGVGSPTHSGQLLVAPNSGIVFGNSATFNAASRLQMPATSTLTIKAGTPSFDGSFQVDGAVHLDDGGSATFKHDVTIGKLTHGGVDINGPGTVTVSDEFLWTRGGLSATVISQAAATIGDAVTNQGLSIGSGATFINQGDATWVAGSLGFGNGALRNEGTFTVTTDANVGVVPFTGGSLDNRGTWTVAQTSGGTVQARRGVPFYNSGDVSLINSNLQYYQFRNNGGSLTLDHSTLEVSDQFQLNAGTIAGDGELIGNLNQTGGTISPGTSPGTLNLTGNLDASGGELLVEIAGPPIDADENDAAGVNYDRLNVSGTATVAGLNVAVLGGFLPTLGSRYTVLTANSVVGPSSDNAALVGMTVPGSDAVIDLLVVSELNTPPVASAGGPYVADEGTEIVFDASASTDAEQSSESLTYEWDFDYDGVIFDSEATGRQVSRSFANQFGSRTVAVMVRDATLNSDLATTTLRVQNVTPSFVTVGGAAVMISLGSDNVATLSGEFLDPGIDDTHSVEILWGDGSSLQRVDIAVGQRNFLATHPYSNNTTGAAREFQVRAAVYDETESSDSIDLVLSQPFINEPPTADAGGPYLVDEGTPFLLDASGSSDPNQAADSLIYEWDLSYDGRNFVAAVSGQKIPQTIDNNTDSPFAYAVRVTDVQGRSNVAATTVTVNNVAPRIVGGVFGTPLLLFNLDSDYLATLSGQFEDPGSDSHSLAIDWGDGSAVTTLDLTPGAREFSATHPYAVPAETVNFELTATVTDQDRAAASASRPVVIREPLAVLRGQKFDDPNANGTRDDGEHGLAGWTIELIDADSGQVVGSTTTDGDGNYEFTDVALGTYVVREVQQTGWRQTYPGDPVVRVSTTDVGVQASGQSDSPTISSAGRYVAFSSLASDLVPGDTNARRDIFVKDTLTGSIERVSIPIDGGQANGPSYTPSISADGSVVTFRSLADNLVQDDRNDSSDIFVYDRRTGSVRRVSVNLDGDEANNDSYSPQVSGDGRFVVFESPASNLVPGDTNAAADIFVADLFTGVIDRVSVSSEGDQGDRDSYEPSISHDGRYVGFTSGSRSFDPADRDGDLDVYVYDRTRHAITWISRNYSGTGGNGDSFSPMVSGDGSAVVFTSAASNLFPGDVNGHLDLYIADISGGRLQRITHGDGPSTHASLTADGGEVFFVSHASDLVAGDSNYSRDVFVYDRELAYFQMLGQQSGAPVPHFMIDVAVSTDGGAIAFASHASDLVADDTNASRDIFVQQRVGVHQVGVTEANVIDDLNFGNEFRLSSIRGQKFSDDNSNGQRDVDLETGAFIEPGLDGWTIRLVDSRTGETWETVTASVDLNRDGLIDPISERGHYEFGPLEPGSYDVYELAQDGWFPSFPRLVLPSPNNYQAAPSGSGGPMPPSGPDPRIFVSTGRDLQLPGPSVPVMSIPAVSEGMAEQLPILYVKGFNDDGASWAESGEYFRSLADVTGGREPVKGSANVDTYGVQFWTTDGGNENSGSDAGDSVDKGFAVLRSLEELADSNKHYSKPSSDAFAGQAAESILSNLTDPQQWIPVCTNLPDLSSCSIPALTFDFQAARSDYNQNGRAKYHADDLYDLLAEELGQPGRLESFSQVNFVTHSAGGLDTRALMSLLQDSNDDAVEQSVANVIYTAPPFGGSTGAEVVVDFFENESIVPTLLDPWTTEVLTDSLFGPFETLLRTFIAEPIVKSVYAASDYVSGEFDSLAERLTALPSEQEILDAINTTIEDIDTLIKTITAALPGGSFGLHDIDGTIATALDSFSGQLTLDIIDDTILPVVKQLLTVGIGLPGLPKIRDDLRPYEAVHENLEQFASNVDIPQFVVWGEGGFLRYLTQMGGVDLPLPIPVDLGPPLEDAAADPNSLHAYGDAERKDLDFSNMDLQPGDGNLSRTSALFLTDLAGGYMTALAGFNRHTHGSISTNLFGEEDNIQGSFLSSDEDNTASVGEVLVETFLTPVTALELSEPAIVVNPAARLYRIGPNAEISFAPEGREFMDAFSRRFGVTAESVEYRVDRAGAEPSEWRAVNPNTFRRSVSDITDQLGLGNEERFTLEWRSINQHGGKEAIRSAKFVIDTAAPSLNRATVVDAEAPANTTQIATPNVSSPRSLLNSGRVYSQLDNETISRVLVSTSIDAVVNIDRDKTIRFEFDSPVSLQYQWNDPTLANARPSLLGDPSAGIVELLIKERKDFEVTSFGFGVDDLRPGVHTVYYRAADDNGNESTIQSFTVLIDDASPLISFSADDGEIVGPTTPLTFFATDVGAGVGEAWIDIPGVGQIRAGASFTLGETTLADQVNSGSVVSLSAMATDRVANSISETYQLTYDYLPPSITIDEISDTVTLPDGRVITTIPEVEISIDVSDDTSGVNLESLRWSLGGFATGFFGTGTFDQHSDGKFVAVVPLVEGLNEVQIQVADQIGNAGTRFVTLLRSPGHHVATGRGDRVEDIDFGNSSFGSIEGVAYEDLNTNGAQDPDEPGFEGVTVYLDRNENGELDVAEPKTQTRSAGEYRFDNVFSRSYVVRQITPLGWEQISPASGQHFATVSLGQQVTDLDFGYSFLGSSVGGNVYEDVNSNGRRDPGERGLTGFQLSLDIGSDGQTNETTTSSGGGAFGFTGITPGEHLVRLSDRSGWTLTTADRISVTIGDFDVIDDLEFGVYADAAVTGVVFGDSDGSGDRDSNESSLAGWTLEIDLNNDGSIDEQIESTLSGFSIPQISAGTHRIRLVGQPGWTRTTPKSVDSFIISVGSGDKIEGIEFGVKDERGVITGNKFYDANADGVRQPNEIGLANWTIFADLDDDELHDPDEPSTITDTDGNYSLPVVPGEYVIREVQHVGWNQTYPRSLQTEAVTSDDRFHSAPRIAGDFIAWADLSFPGFEIKISDGTQTTTVLSDTEVGVLFFDVDAQGRMVWITDPDFDEENDRELYYFDGTTTRRQTRNGVDDESPVIVDGKVAWRSGSSVLLFDGSQTLVLSQGAGDPSFDGENVAFFGSVAQNNYIGAFLYDGTTVRPLTNLSGSTIAIPTVSGDYVVWFEVDASDSAVFLFDGQTTEQIAPFGEGGLADVDDQGRVVWLKPTGNGGSDVMYFDGTNVIALTSDGLVKDDLAIDDGIAVWRTEYDDTVHISIFDGREVFTPAGFFASTSPVTDGGRVAFVGYEEPASRPQIHVTDARTYHRVVVAKNGQVDDIDFGNQTDDVILSGIVFDDTNANGVFDANEPGINRATVELRIGTARTLVATVETDQNGHYEFIVDPLLDYRISTRTAAEELVTTPDGEGYTINALAGRRLDNLHFGVSSEIVISGQVFNDVDADGQRRGLEVGMDDVNVVIVDAGTGNEIADLKTFSMDLNNNGTIEPGEESGRFEFELPRADYLVRITPQSPWFATTADEISVSADWPRGADLGFGLQELSSQDSDGIVDIVEDGAPNQGDGNNDGVADREQANIASLPNAVDGTYVTIVAPAGMELVAVTATANPDPDNSPTGVGFPIGFINFEIHGVPVGGRVDVEFILHNSAELTGYYKYGPTADNRDPHFYAFNKTRDYGVQKLKPGSVRVRYTDGLTGDDDLSPNGIIVDPGVPGVITEGPVQNPIDPTDVNNDDSTTALDALRVINFLGREGVAHAGPVTDSGLVFLDVSGDQEVTALDALQVINAMSRIRLDGESESMPDPITAVTSARMVGTTPTSDTKLALEPPILATDSSDESNWLVAEFRRANSQATLPAVAGVAIRTSDYAEAVDELFIKDEFPSLAAERNAAFSQPYLR